MQKRERNNEIRKLARLGISVNDLALKYNLTTSRIREIIDPKKRKWCNKHRYRYSTPSCVLCKIVEYYPKLIKLKGMLEKELAYLSEQDRDREKVWKRAIVVKYLRDTKKLGWNDIGELLERDHSSVIYLYKKII